MTETIGGFTELADELMPGTTIVAIYNDDVPTESYRKRKVLHFDESMKMYRVRGMYDDKDKEYWVGMNWWHSYVRRETVGLTNRHRRSKRVIDGEVIK
tara:strand:- start:179 stop:472 length:294 start_codon:yes stop_codon:yes gene_type:complete